MAERCTGYVQAAVTAQWKNVWPTSVTAHVLEAVDLMTAASGDITDTFTVATNTPVTGVGSSEYAPIATALLLSLSTPNYVAGRRVRGRIFFSPVANNMVQSDGTPASTALGFLLGGGTGLLADLDEGDEWVVWHRPKSGSGGLACGINATTAPDKFAILRSRRD